MGLYALKITIGFQRMACLPTPLLVVNQAILLSQHLPEQGLTPWTNRQPCGRHHMAYLIGKPMTTQHHQKSHFDDFKEVFLVKERNSFHRLGKKLDYIYLKDALK